MHVPLSKMFVDEEMKRTAIEVLEGKRFIKGPHLAGFEKEFAEFCGSKHGIAVSSGTTALYAAFWALGIKQGDEIIAPSHTFIATVNPAILLGGKPVFADIEEKTYTVDPREIEKKITPKTKAIVPVHLYGQPVDMDPILEVAEKKGVTVIEDACQAHASEYKGRKIGSMGRIACFSFFPSKNLGAYGDGGMVITDDAKMAGHMLSLRNHGSKVRYYHDEIGFNTRLDEMQAAVLNVKFKRIDQYNANRRKNALLYNEHFSASGIQTPV
ncbi:TPA: DegT/DnrJ/EryC1/StrS family aminotransferase, partial [Candidatus Micrarchaeota archaeon]|nr:DegT/DnrJ/EryC1/StrS family aminotransferase [Candidatus Micrarchaeota archaeon]